MTDPSNERGNIQINSVTSCPTCGVEVKIGGDDKEGTHYYIPIPKGCDHLDGPYRKLLEERDEFKARYEAAREVAIGWMPKSYDCAKCNEVFEECIESRLSQRTEESEVQRSGRDKGEGKE